MFRTGSGAGWSALGTAVAALALGAGTSGAQQAADARWLPWLGCWQAEGALADSPLICVGPSETGVEIVTIEDGQVSSSRSLVADGRRQTVETEGCTGWQSAEFSRDGRRAFLRSELTCEGGVERTASAIMGLASPAEWLDAQSIGLAGDRMARVTRYRVAAEDVSRAAGFAPAADRAQRVADARLLAAAGLSLADVAEAAARVDVEALEAYLIERAQPFEVDASRLSALSAAGVPDAVIDVVVAVSYPQKFVIDQEQIAPARPADREARRADRYGYEPFGWGGYGRGAYRGCAGFSYFGSSYFSGICDPYGYRYGLGYGWDPYGYGYWSSRPIIIVRGNGDGADDVDTHGRVVNGRGYTRGGSGRSSARTPSYERPSSTVVGGSRSGTSVSSGGYSSGSGAASTGSSSSGRTAKKKSGGS